jgi:CRP-like cAMP-binding protein
VLVKDQFKKDIYVRDIKPGSLFGEVALLYDTKRTATVRSKDQCLIGSLSEENFLELVQNYPEI